MTLRSGSDVPSPHVSDDQPVHLVSEGTRAFGRLRSRPRLVNPLDEFEGLEATLRRLRLNQTLPLPGRQVASRKLQYAEDVLARISGQCALVCLWHRLSVEYAGRLVTNQVPEIEIG